MAERKKRKRGPNLSVGRGEKLPASKGAGLTAKGRAKYNRETGSNLKPPVTGKPKSKAQKPLVRSLFALVAVDGQVNGVKRPVVDGAVSNSLLRCHDLLCAGSGKNAFSQLFLFRRR